MARSAAINLAGVAVVVALAVHSPAFAGGFFIEAEVGGRWASADWGDMDWGGVQASGRILGPGVTVGGTLGYHLTPLFAIVGHGDLGLHSAPEKLTLSDGYTTVAGEFVESGASMALLLGGRVYPLGGDAKAPVQPYFGAGVGLGSIAWEYAHDVQGLMGTDTDAVGALLFAAEAGGDIAVSDLISLGVSGRYILHRWSSESIEELDTSHLDGNSTSFAAHIGLHF